MEYSVIFQIERIYYPVLAAVGIIGKALNPVVIVLINAEVLLTFASCIVLQDFQVVLCVAKLQIHFYPLTYYCLLSEGYW